MVLAIQSYNIRQMHHLQEAGQEVVIMWPPGLSCILANVLVDAVVKHAAVGIQEFICVPYTDWYQLSKNTLIGLGRKIRMNVIHFYINHNW